MMIYIVVHYEVTCCCQRIVLYIAVEANVGDNLMLPNNYSLHCV